MLHETQFLSKSEYEKSLRDYLAAAALTPIFNKIEGRGERMEVLQYVAEAAYQLADAMIVEREKRDGKD